MVNNHLRTGMILQVNYQESTGDRQISKPSMLYDFQMETAGMPCTQADFLFFQECVNFFLGEGGARK